MRVTSKIGRTFMEYTKYKYQIDSTDQTARLPQPSLADAIKEGCQVFDLPDPMQDHPKFDLIEAMNNRVSERRYSDQPLTLKELSLLLWVTQGVKEVTNRPATLRTVPSAGSRHPFETYLLINKVEGLEPGLYQYAALDHKLMLISNAPELNEQITDVCHKQGMVKNSAVTFIWAAEVYRTYWRYVERGYRYMHLDAGHICQNLYLAVEAIQAGCCGIGAFEDDAFGEILGLEPDNRIPIYVASVGKKVI